VDVDDLYGAPLDQFVPERTALARELRKEGRREEAAQVAALRKPSVAAWAVNQLVRTQPRSVKGLFDAGDALRTAHELAASGRGDAQALRQATQGERSAVDTLVEAARGLLTSEGHELSPAVIDRVTDTLQAAALDPDARSKVSEGRLERELRHVGLGFVGDPGALPAEAPKRAAKRKTRPDGAQVADGENAERERAEHQRRERERNDALKAARAAESKARREVQQADRAVEVAKGRRDKAAKALDNADEALATAQARAHAAAEAHRRATEDLERI
jgi:hypothetical protein